MKNSLLKSLLSSIVASASGLLEDISNLSLFVHFKNKKNWRKIPITLLQKCANTKMVPAALISRFFPTSMTQQPMHAGQLGAGRASSGSLGQNAAANIGVTGKDPILPAVSRNWIASQAITPAASAGPLRAGTLQQLPGAAPSVPSGKVAELTNISAAKGRRTGGGRAKSRHFK